MKKKVRIYKAPDGQGKVINKLSKFLSKAQEGGMPDPNVMGYPQETEELNEDQLSQMIISDISNGRSKVETVMKIANSSGLDPLSIDQFYEQIYSSLESQRDAEAEDEVEEDETEDQYAGEELEPVQEIEEDFYGDDVNNDIANDVASEDEEEDYSDEDAFASDLVMKHGGSYKKAKNAFVKQQVSLVKKQAGGAEQTKTNDSDPIGADFRKNKLQEFIGTLKDESAQAKAKEQAEQQFDQMMQQQQQMPQYPMEQPMAQFGMQMPRRGLFGRPKMPRGFGFGYGMPPVTKMDVRRTGIFGRPKEYSMEFGMPGVMPGMGFPGMGAGFYGYGQTTKQGGKTKGRIITEEVAKTVNNEATKEVAANTQGNTATDKPNDGAASNATPGSTASNVQVNTANSNKRKNVAVNDEATDAVVNNSETTREKKKQKDLYLQGLPGSSYAYQRVNDQWQYWDPKKNKYFKVGNEGNLAKLEAGENKGATFSVLPNNPGFYYRRANDGSYIKFKGDPENHTAQTQPVGKITKKNTVPFNNLEKNADHFLNTLEFPNAPVQKNNIPYEQIANTFYMGMNPFSQIVNAFKQTGGQAYTDQLGGFVDSGNPDLYKFIYGGNDIDQSDIDDVYSKDTTDPYFQYGGLTTYQEAGETDENYCYQGATNCFPRKTDNVDTPWSVSNPNNVADNFNPRFGSSIDDRYPKKNVDFETRLAEEKKKWEQEYMQRQNPYPNIGYNGFNAFGSLFPANIATNRGSWAQMRRGPYDKLTGANIPGMGFGPNTQVQSIDVTKSGMFGRPKKYTINYGNQEMDPRKQNLITLPGQGTTPAAQSTGAGRTFSNTEGLGAGATGAIRRGERRTARELARGEKQNLSASDANLDPYAGFPLDHPIRTEEKLATNSVKDYLKPSQKSPSSLGLSPFVAAPAQQKLDDSNVPSAFKVPIGNALTSEQEAYNKMIEEQESQKILQSFPQNELGQFPIATSMMDNPDNTIENPFTKNDDYDFYSNPENQSEAPIGSQSLPINSINNIESSQYSPNRLQLLFNRLNPSQKQTSRSNPNKSTLNRKPVQRVTPEEYQRRLDEDLKLKKIYREKYIKEREQRGKNVNLNPTDKELADMRNTYTVENFDKPRNALYENRGMITKLLQEGKIDQASFDKEMLRLEKIAEGYDKQKQEYYDAIGFDVNQKQRNPETWQWDALQKRKAEKKKRLENLASDPVGTLQKNPFKNPFKQFGGDLSRFVGGGDSPVTYTDNPALVGMSNVDMLTLNEGIQDLKPSSFWSDQQSFNEKVPVNTQKQPEEIKMDKAQLSSDQATPGNFSMDFKTKNTWELDPEGSLAVANAGIRGAAGLIDRFRNKGREREMYEGMNAENLYAVDPSRDRGDYDTNTGLYRAADMGQTWNSRSKQYGGAMNDYYEDEEVDMTEEELANFLANGGEVEYL